MEPIKTSNNVEFDVIYADGSRYHAAEGILFEANREHMVLHNGTSRIEVLFAITEVLEECIKDAGLQEAFEAYRKIEVQKP